MQRPTPWRDGPGGTTDLDADDLLATVGGLLHQAADDLTALPGCDGATVDALAVSGMGETGILLDRDGNPAARGVRLVRPARTRAGDGGCSARPARRVRGPHRPARRGAGVGGQAAAPARRGPGPARAAVVQPARVRRRVPGGPRGQRVLPRLAHRAARPGHRRAVDRDARPPRRRRRLPPAAGRRRRRPRARHRVLAADGVRRRPRHGRRARPPRLRGVGRRDRPRPLPRLDGHCGGAAAGARRTRPVRGAAAARRRPGQLRAPRRARAARRSSPG